MTGAAGQGSNSVAVRRYNECVVLTSLRRLGEASKADLAKSAGLTANAVGQIVDELEHQRLICSVGKRHGARGQPATLLRLDPEGVYSIGLKIGRRSIDSLLVDFAGNMIERRRTELTFPLPEEAFEIASKEISILRRRIPRKSKGALTGVGLAMPYNLGSWRTELGITREAFSAWNEFDISEKLTAAIGLPIFVENDGTAAAIAELFYGHGRKLNDFVNVFIGTAIGGGVVLNGDYRRGISGNAGDIGLMPVLGCSGARPKGQPFDLLLSHASISSLIRLFERHKVPISSRAELDAAITGNGNIVDLWLSDCVKCLVLPLLSVSCLLDLEAIVIDGDLPRSLISRLVGELARQLSAAAPESRTPPVVLPGLIGCNAASVGAAILPLHANYSPKRQSLFGQAGPQRAVS